MAFAQYITGKPRKWKLDTTSPLQDIIFSIDNSLIEESHKTTGCQKCGRHTYEVFQVFCSKSSLHGLQYIGEKSNVLLRLFWALIIFMALGFSIYHICQLYKKWEDTPVMVTLSPKVKKIQEVYFPAVTICAPRILTKSSETNFLNAAHENYNRSKEIVETFCNNNINTEDWNYSSFEDNPILENYTRLSCGTLLHGATFPNGRGHFNKIYPYHVTRSKAIIQHSVIDCCTFNGLSEDVMYRNINYTENEVENKDQNNLLKPTGIGIRNAFTYKLADKIRCPDNFEFKVSIHHPSEAPNIEGDGLIVKTGSKISYTVKPQYTQASESLKSLKPKSRGCQFADDMNLRFFRNYTQHNCMLDCLANYTIDECGCLPPYLPENNGTLQLCNGSKLMCFTQALNEFRDSKHASCNCDQPCEDTMYVVSTQFVPSTKEEAKVEFDVYFTEPVFFFYHRSELYGLSDFLSSCGGILGLFMGFSVISMIEVFYFSSFGIWRLLTGICGRKHKENHRTVPKSTI